MVLSVAAVVLGLTAAGLAPVGASSRSPHGVTEASEVTITRDSEGVAHIRAADFTALGYGEAWAFAEDNFCSLAQDFVTVTGERSRYFGPNGESISYATGAEDTNLASDLFWQSVISSGIIAKEMGEAPPNGPLPQVRQMYTGFVDGYNAYLASGRLTTRPVPAGPGFIRSPWPTCSFAACSSSPKQAADSSSPPRSTPLLQRRVRSALLRKRPRSCS